MANIEVETRRLRVGLRSTLRCGVVCVWVRERERESSGRHRKRRAEEERVSVCGCDLRERGDSKCSVREKSG